MKIKLISYNIKYFRICYVVFFFSFLHFSFFSYRTMTFVIYNQIVVKSQIIFHQNLIFMMNNQQLIKFVHNASSLRLLAISKLNVKFVRDNIIFNQINIHCSSYLNVIFIQFHERTMRQSCLACRNETSNLRSFSKCRRAVEHFDEAYVNCKWRDHVNRRFVRKNEMNDDVIIVDHRRLTSLKFDENDRVNHNDLNSSTNNAIVLF
jgi:hypothetical protein